MTLKLHHLRPAPGAKKTWFRRGSGSGSGHAEASLPRKSSGKLINANEERFALAA